MNRELQVNKDHDFSYTIHYDTDFTKLPDLIRRTQRSPHRICIVTDDTVASFYQSKVQEALLPHYSQVETYVIPAGEKHKNLDTVQGLYEFLILHGFDRKDMLLALGGGVVGDLTGFTAATYLRGIDFVQVPTTLLAQIDSSIGGKTGVDFSCYKNMVGAFHQPRMVYMNVRTLDTLSPELFACGMGEILKHGLIRNGDYFRWLLSHAKEIWNQDPDVLHQMIYESCKIKKNVVENDPLEIGERAVLNFGHTIGHAVEKLMNFQLYHGHCVAVGCVAAAYISYRRGLIDKASLHMIEDGMRLYQLPVKINGLKALDVLEATKKDKKMEQGQIKFVLLDSIGHAYVDATVTDQELTEGISYILNT